jgi:hypothetical protein
VDLTKFEVIDAIDIYDGLATLAVVENEGVKFLRYWNLEDENNTGFLIAEVNEETLNKFKNNEWSLRRTVFSCEKCYNLVYPLEYSDNYKHIVLDKGKLEKIDPRKEDYFESELFIEDFL